MEECGFNFTVRTKEIDETPPKGLVRSEIAMKLAEMKADAIIDLIHEDEFLITADTIVCLDDNVLNKPLDASHAKVMLNYLSNKNHQVYTGVCILNKKSKTIFSVETDVFFNELSDELIDEYVNKFKPFDKAGSYGAQECLPSNMNPCSEIEIEFMRMIGKPNLFSNTVSKSVNGNVPIIKSISGSYFNVMGLPVVELVERLNSMLPE